MPSLQSDLSVYVDELDRAAAHAASDHALKLVRASWLVASVCRERVRSGDRVRALIILGKLEQFLAREANAYPSVSRNAAGRICGQLAAEIARTAP